MIVVIHSSRNPNDIASVSFVLLNAESQQFDLLFDASLSENVDVNSPPAINSHVSDILSAKNYTYVTSDGLLPTPNTQP